MANKIKPNQGYTVLEILTVCIVISVLAMIAIPNFIRLQDNAKEASLETNARTLRVMLETYKVDHRIYPDELRTLGREATAKKYNREVANPYNSSRGLVENGKWALDYLGEAGPVGMVAYQAIDSGAKYYIFCYGRDGKLIKRNGKIYTLSNG